MQRSHPSIADHGSASSRRQTSIGYRQWIRSLLFGFAWAVSTTSLLAAIDFSVSKLQFTNPYGFATTLQFGPDGRLYVGSMGGLITAHTIVRNAANSYVSTNVEVIDLVRLIPNYDDFGVPEPSIVGRQLTGILVKGTPSSPVIYVTSCDPREGAGAGGYNGQNLDTNSGILSKLTRSGGTWQKVDLIRGLPRSQENHAISGLQLDEATQTIYLTVGGNTNAGAPSINFAFLPETALSASILKIDLNAIEAMPTKVDSFGQVYKYDVPTLDDPNPNRSRNPDGSNVNDPFGGNNGLNQARLDPTGPLQIYATGFRNPYDVLLSRYPGREGKIYTWDNAGNPGWGGYPMNNGTDGTVTNQYIEGEPGIQNNLDNFHLVTPGYYGGHPNPIRANPAGAGWMLFNPSAPAGSQYQWTPSPTSDWPPVPVAMANPIEGRFILQGAPDNPDLLTNNSSTNGLDEYTAPNFNGALQGNIIAAGFNGKNLLRIVLNPSGTQVLNGREVLASNFGNLPLDVTIPTLAQAPQFYGTIWVAHYLDRVPNITVLEPADFANPGTNECTGIISFELDDDRDGFSNADEDLNETNPCNAASSPPDYDGDKLSDRLDSDDDNDGLPDTTDAFPLDATNASTATLPYHISLYNTDTGFFGVGMTGLMRNPGTDYLGFVVPDDIVAGGTAGLMTLGSVGSGTAKGTANSQENAYYFGFKPPLQNQRYFIHVSVAGPFFGGAGNIAGGQSHGIFLGTGDQDNYVKLALNANGGAGAIELTYEDQGVVVSDQLLPYSAFLNDGTFHFYLTVDPEAGTVQAAVRRESEAGLSPVGLPIDLIGTLRAAVLSGQPLALGVVATTGASGTPSFTATWDDFTIVPLDDTPPPSPVNLAPVAVTENSVRLTWDDPVNPSDVVGYRVYVDGILRATTSTGNVVIDGLAPGTTYLIEVASLDATNVESNRLGASVHTLFASTPTNSRIRINAGGSAHLDIQGRTWSADAGFNTGSAVGAIVAIDGTTEPVLFQSHRTDAPEAPDLAYAFDLAPGAYQVRLYFAEISGGATVGSRVFAVSSEGSLSLPAVDIFRAVGNASALTAAFPVVISDGQLNLSFARIAGNPLVSAIEILALPPGDDTSPPTAPGSLGSINVTATAAGLTWAAASDNVGVVGYQVLRNGQTLTTVAGTSFNDTGLTPSTLYAYQVVAVDAAGNASLPAPLSLSTPALPDTLPPSTPAGLTASAITTSSLSLAWTASTDNVAVTGYQVRRGGVLLATVSSPSFADSGLSPATLYTYQVVALDAAGNASAPASLSVSTAAGSGTTVLRINAGGGNFVDSSGNTWSADSGSASTPGRPIPAPSASTARSTTPCIRPSATTPRRCRP